MSNTNKTTLSTILVDVYRYAQATCEKLYSCFNGMPLKCYRKFVFRFCYAGLKPRFLSLGNGGTKELKQ